MFQFSGDIPMNSHGNHHGNHHGNWRHLWRPGVTAQTSWEIQPKAVEVTTWRRQDLQESIALDSRLTLVGGDLPILKNMFVNGVGMTSHIWNGQLDSCLKPPTRSPNCFFVSLITSPCFNAFYTALWSQWLSDSSIHLQPTGPTMVSGEVIIIYPTVDDVPLRPT